MSEGITVVLEYAGNSSDRINSKTLAGGAVNDIRLGGDTCFTIVMLSVFALVGTTGNALVIYVMSSRRRDGLTSTMFIMVLAVVDLSTCVFIVPSTAFMEMVKHKVSSDFVCRLYNFMTSFTVPFSSLLMTAIAVDRYLCICHPFWHMANVTRSRWIIAIAVLGLSSAGLGLTFSLTHSVYTLEFLPELNGDGVVTTASRSWPGSKYDVTEQPSTNVTSYEENQQQPTVKMKMTILFTGHCYSSEIFISSKAFHVFHNYYEGGFIGNLIVVSVIYALIYRSVRHGRQWRKKRASIASSKLSVKSKERMSATATMTSSIIKMQVMKTKYRQTAAMTRATTMQSSTGPPTVGRQVSRISTDDGCVREEGVTSDGGCTNKQQMESIIHESFVIGCDQDECKKENNDKGIGRPADNDTAAGACASDLLTATAILSDFGDEYSEYGDASTVRDGNIELLVIKLSARHAKTQLDKRPTDVKLPNGDGSPNNWDACSNCGACQAGVAMPNNEEDTNEVDGILSVLGVQAKSDMNCCSGSKTAFLRHLQTANVTETVDVLSRSSSVDSKVTTDVVGRSCLTEVIKGTVSSPEVQKNIIAEVKMATMLFAVTVVFALTFLPGSAMIFKLIPYNKSVFNMYFFNFVANPIIYSFMSNSFRKQLKGLFNKRRQH